MFCEHPLAEACKELGYGFSAWGNCTCINIVHDLSYSCNDGFIEAAIEQALLREIRRAFVVNESHNITDLGIANFPTYEIKLQNAMFASKGLLEKPRVKS